ncbi:MAG: magnesium and cobalt transport protein CorA [Gallionellales bacterium RIFCSPLOWO2_12_FULL_57_18]|nr:MAG: magnesium and cobalt transport protein CorA [Gallionellales bacterium RIFCSPLOWO2_12_FULL_57_18]OGS96852.1 MAG: magnesium and cobalt transport protein CorA [Gallionellales bacterium RIFCSPLOWO2_02_FULL_57_47]
MFNIYTLDKGRLVRIQPEEIAVRKPIWVDVIAPGEDEREWVDKAFSIILPQPEHLRDIEASARFYEEDDELHLRSDFLLGKESGSRSVIVAFVLANNVLFSVHDEDLPVFQRFRMRSHVQPDLVTDCHDVLIDLYGSDVEFSADALEETYADLGGTSGTVLNNTLSDKDAAMVLASIAHAEHLNGRIRRNLMDTRRAVSFLMRSKLLTTDQMEEARQIMQDIDSLDGHTAFLFDKINFLMNTTVGFININQNKIVRLFSVAAVALLPPTLVASVYGMNFRHMPELEWANGYPFALSLMALSVAVPLWVFWRKGWLK